MAAPQLVYSSKLLSFLPVAKLLHNSTTVNGTIPPDWWDTWGDGYFNSGDSDALKLAKIKSIFRLDFLLRNNEGFIGAVVTNGTNINFHSNTRFSRYRLQQDGITYIILNDGGLNTLGYSDIAVVLSNDAPNKDANPANYPPRLNNSVAFALAKSAYYVPSSSIKVQMQDIDTPSLVYDIHSLSNIGEKVLSNIKSDIIAQITKAGTYYFRTTVTNAEGTWTSDWVGFQIQNAIFNFRYNSSQASLASIGTQVTRYSTTRELLDAQDNGSNATQLFIDEGASPTHTANGYYFLSPNWYQYGYDTLTNRYCILAKGEAQPGGYPSGDPGNIVQSGMLPNINGFSPFDWETAESQILSGNYITTTLYIEYNYETNVVTAYTNSAFTQLAQSGYYVQGTWQLQNLDRYIQVGGNGIVLYDETYKP